MKRILMVSVGGLGNGGVQAVMMSIVRNLSNTYRFDMLLFTNEKRHYDEEFLSYGGRIYRIPRYEGTNPLKKKVNYYIRGTHLYKAVLKLLQEHGPYDAIHCHNEFESAPVLMAAAKAGVPIRIAHTHVAAHRTNFLAKWLDSYRKNKIAVYATAKVSCSEAAIRNFYKNPNNAQVINNVFDHNRFDLGKYLQNAAKEFRLLQIGRFDSIKNQLFSVGIMNCIREKYPEARLVLVGADKGNYTAAVEREIASRNLQEHITLLPGNADTPVLLSQSAALLLPSLNEGFGIVLVEAQAMGVRCYASDTVPKAADCGGVTYLSLKDGAEVWAERIIEDYQKNQGACGRFDVSEYTVDKVMEKYKRLYEGES